MPDTGASRKRQIQITPRLFRDAGASRAFLASGRYPVLRVWARLSGLRGLGDTQPARQPARRARRETRPLRGVFSVRLPHAPRRNRVKLIRCRRAGDSIHANQGSRSWRASAGSAALYNCLPTQEISGLPSSFAGFLPWLGVRRQSDAVASRGRRAMSLIRCLYNGCAIARCGFGDLAFDSMREGRAGGHEPLVAVPTPAIPVSIGAIRKCRIKTMPCRETSITNACYLCNTLWKRGGVRPFRAVPLLRVQKSSVIVITRRRGASRGRPVRWFA